METAERGLLLISESFHHADMYYAIRYLFGDPVIYVRYRGQETLVCSNFERDLARERSRVSEVLNFEELGFATLRQQLPTRHQAFAEMVRRLLASRGITAVTVTDATPLTVVDHLRAGDIEVVADPEALEGARLVKDADELLAIEVAQRAAERAMRRAIDLIAASEPRGDLLMVDGAPLTAEDVRAAIDGCFLADGCVGEGTIAACGADAASPHNRGAGPLHPNQSIVLDLFPYHQERRYYADMTRTVSKGDPGPELRRMYDATLRAQDLAMKLIRPGASGKAIYEAVCRSFEDAGYATSLRTGTYPATGFIHGLGHGVGLEIHERPTMGYTDEMLAEGQVVTVEPGLYDPAVGGVRLEDLVVVTADGCRNLTLCEKRLVV